MPDVHTVNPHPDGPVMGHAEAFAKTGMLVLRGLASPDECAALRNLAQEHIDPLLGPVEFEADVRYPGAPISREAAGGATPRRLLSALTRSPLVRSWATGARLGNPIATLLGSDRVHVSQCHHNCIMTKHPGYSSATGWHQDIRYWSFDRSDLVSAWLALGDENHANGGLRVIPGSHRLEVDRGRLDAELFLRDDLTENRALIDQAVDVTLNAGDVLLFHSNVFHAAGINRTDAVKLSVVFTYHAGDNLPIPGTRSATHPSLPVATSRVGDTVPFPS